MQILKFLMFEHIHNTDDIEYMIFFFVARIFTSHSQFIFQQHRVPFSCAQVHQPNAVVYGTAMSACQRSQERHAVAELLKDFVTEMMKWWVFYWVEVGTIQISRVG